MEYEALPFPTAGIAKVPAGETLRGPITREDFEWQIGQLRRGKAPGPDEVPYELLATAPEAFKDTPFVEYRCDEIHYEPKRRRP
jgi:hypothetical protein